MAWVRCFYEEDYNEPTGLLYLETQSKRVEWDGLTLKVGMREIHTHEWFEEILKQTGTGYAGGFTDIPFLEIDGVVLINNMHQEDYAGIENAPTVDAVPVVRCRECKHWSGRNDKPGEVTAIGYCNHPNHHIIPLRADWFCADGAKMDGGAADG